MNRHIKILYYLTKRTLEINLFILYKIKLTFGEVKGVFMVILVVRRQKPEKNNSLWLPLHPATYTAPEWVTISILQAINPTSDKYITSE